MTDSSDFSDGEWALVRRSPLLVFYYVAKADESVDACEVERLIELLGRPEEYASAVLTQVVSELMSDAENLGATVAAILDDANQDLESQFNTLGKLLDERLNPDDAKSFKLALSKLGIDIAAATGDTDLPVSREEWTELEAFKRLIGLNA